MHILPARSIAFAAVLALSHSAFAADAQTDERKRAGDAAFDEKRYEDAITVYTQAYIEEPDPALLYNRGRAHQALGRHVRALQDFEAFRRAASPALLAKVPALDGLISAMRA